MYVTAESFEAALSSLTRLYATRDASLRVGGNGEMSVALVGDNAVVEKVLSQHDLSIEQFRKCLPDITDVASAILNGVSPEEFSRVRSQPRRLLGTEAIDLEDVSIRKLALARDMLPLSDLLRRKWIKESSKTDIFSDVDWEVSIKEVDDWYRQPDGEARFALIKLRGEDPTTGELRSFILTMDEEDVRYLARHLRRLYARLAPEMADAEAEKAALGGATAGGDLT